MIYSLSFLINEWKVRAGLEPARIDSTVTRHDAFDIDAYVERLVNDWYVKLLQEGDLKYLDPEDITDLITVSAPDKGVATLTLPEGVFHIVEIMDSKWERPARIVTPASRDGRLQESVFSRGGSASPVAVFHNNTTIKLYSYMPGTVPQLERVLAVRHVPGKYRLSPLALSLITPSFLNS